MRPYTPVGERERAGEFDLLVKRYKQWGKPGERNYRPPGAVSNYLFEWKPGDEVEFKHIKFNLKIPYNRVAHRFPKADKITMIAVGVGIAPMIQALTCLFSDPECTTQVKLLLGNRSVSDILLRSTLDGWETSIPDRFKVVHHVGTRYAGIVSHKNTCPKSCRAPCPFWVPPLPKGWETLKVDGREATWVNEASIRKHGFAPKEEGSAVFVCGLPSVYDALCGPRGQPLEEGSALARIGFTNEQVTKF